MSTYLLEVGTEELPASFIDSALAQWRSRLPSQLAENDLAPEAIAVYGTPRRLAFVLHGLPAKQPDRDEEVKGPPAQAAFKDGQPTKAAEGFARKQGVELGALEVRETDKGPFVFVRKQIVGRSATELLPELIPDWVFGLEGKRFMRWGDGDLRFPRPIRWLVSLLDDAVLPIEFINGSITLSSDRYSRGHRVLHPEAIAIPHAEHYAETLARAYVSVDPQQRREAIATQVRQQAETCGGRAILDEELLAEVTNLVEYPTVATGKFDEAFLNLPSEVIATEMIDHQRYFPVWKTENAAELLPYFITASNGDPAQSATIAAGNERVIRARLADGQFFYKTDLAQPLERYLPKLETVTFQEQLGSVRAKVDRIVEVASWVAEQLEASDRDSIERAALLCKADLVTQMVGEFPELQGIMGEKYARASGESPEVARAISEHYLPRGASDRLPETLAGQIVGIADRLDTLVSIFGLGAIPTGSSDPFALRRAANAIVTIAWERELPLNLRALLQKAVEYFVATFGESKHTGQLGEQLETFFVQRMRSLLEDAAIDYDLINAVLGEGDAEYTQRALEGVLDVFARAQFLQTIRRNGTLDTIYETVNRSARLAAKGDLDTQALSPAGLVRPDRFEQASEQAFYNALLALVPQTQAAREQRNYQRLVDGLAQIAPVVSRFFDGEESVLIMADDPDIQRNRLNLLGLLRNHARTLADFGAIVKT